MHFLIIFAIIFGGGTVFVIADFYIELKDSVGFRSNGEPIMGNFLYECQGVPAGTSAIRAAGSSCIPITSQQQKDNIYANCNFYIVIRPNPVGHYIYLSDRGLITHAAWNLGYLNNAVDHPNFAAPSLENISFIKSKLTRLSIATVVPHYLVDDLTFYFAQTNLIAFSRTDPVLANSLLSAFATLLRRITEQYGRLNQDPNATEASLLRLDFDSAMKMCLHKMIDPCTVLLGNLRTFAVQYCSTYCNFLNLAARRFGASRECSALEGGNCVGIKCTCNRVLSNPFRGCQSTTISMQECNNVVRDRIVQWQF